MIPETGRGGSAVKSERENRAWVREFLGSEIDINGEEQDERKILSRPDRVAIIHGGGQATRDPGHTVTLAMLHEGSWRRRENNSPRADRPSFGVVDATVIGRKTRRQKREMRLLRIRGGRMRVGTLSGLENKRITCSL